MNIVQKLAKSKVIDCPPWLPDNVHYVTLMGSHAYAVNNKDSDKDIYGFCIPPKEEVFPSNSIIGFGKLRNGGNRFTSWQASHLQYEGEEVDITIYNIVDYFHLLSECNPNMLDSLFTAQRCVMTQSAVAQLVRENRRLFLSKKAWHTFKGYAYSMRNKANNKVKDAKRYSELKSKEDNLSQGEALELNSLSNRKRLVAVAETDAKQDWKFLYHLVRLLDECEQILETGDIDLMRDNARLKAIRRGEISIEQINKIFEEKETRLEKLYNDSKLVYAPRMDEIKDLLFKCLEMHYGSIQRAESYIEGAMKRALAKIDEELHEVRSIIYA